MPLELTRPLICFDLETTGVNPQFDRIVQLACIKVMPDSKELVKDVRMNPCKEIPPEAAEVHGITNEMVKDEPTFQQFSKALYKFFQGCDVAGYNVRQFDVPLLSLEFARAGIKWPEPEMGILDTFEILTKLEERDLAWALRYYTGEQLLNAHDAGADALAAFKVLKAQATKYGVFTPLALENLTHDPNCIDLQGKFRRNEEGEVCITFGKHKDKPLSVVPRDYLEWMLDQDFLPDTKSVVEEFLGLTQQGLRSVR